MNSTGGDAFVSKLAVILIVSVIATVVLFGVFMVLLNQGSNAISRLAAA